MKIINDRIYGRTRIDEPIILELLQSPALLRLKKISQFGVPDDYYFIKNYYRYEHSIGVMIFLRKLGVTLEEQIAGLLHDISVLAFSHIADWVFAEGHKGSENYHNQIHKRFFLNTEVPSILKKYNFLVPRILNDKNFNLLEKEIPDLCADRVDYALREFKNKEQINKCLNSLINYNGEIVFKDQEAAFIFAHNFIDFQTNHWGDKKAVMRYYLFAKVLKIALKKKIIFKKDFFADEKNILFKLEKSENKQIKIILAMLRKGNFGKMLSRKRKIIKKFRFVDPKIIYQEKTVRLSQINNKFRTELTKHRAINKKGVLV